MCRWTFLVLKNVYRIKLWQDLSINLMYFPVPEPTPVGMIVGIVVGVVALVVIVIVVFIFVRRRSSKAPHMYVWSTYFFDIILCSIIII